MADITGTEGADTLRGTDAVIGTSAGIDKINALGGDDIIVGTTGNDEIDGGAGNDVADYSKIGESIRLSPTGFFTNFGERLIPGPTPPRAVNGSIKNIETFIGEPQGAAGEPAKQPQHFSIISVSPS